MLEKYSPSEQGLCCNARYPQSEFKLQSQASVPLPWCELPSDRGISIMHVSRVQALQCGFKPQLNRYTTSTFLPLNHRWRWREWDALKYWLLYKRLSSSYTYAHYSIEWKESVKIPPWTRWMLLRVSNDSDPKCMKKNTELTFHPMIVSTDLYILLCRVFSLFLLLIKIINK